MRPALAKLNLGSFEWMSKGDVLLLDDILDTGQTLATVKEALRRGRLRFVLRCCCAAA